MGYLGENTSCSKVSWSRPLGSDSSGLSPQFSMEHYIDMIGPRYIFFFVKPKKEEEEEEGRF